jgi:hypothetical protein
MERPPEVITPTAGTPSPQMVLASRSSYHDLGLLQEAVFPSEGEMSPEAIELITGLLKKNPDERLGDASSDDIKQHPFYRSAP